MLGRLVDAAAGVDASPRNRADIHEVRDAARIALGRPEQVRERRVADVDQPLRLSSIIRSHSSTGASTIVPSNITPALLTTMSSRPNSSRSLDGGVRLLAVGDVGLDGQPTDLGRERVQPVLAARDDGDRRAVGGERLGGGVADAAARARDERDGPFQPDPSACSDSV